MFKKCLQNRIACQSAGYKCYLCRYEIQDRNFIAVENHILTEKHQKKINQIDKEVRATESSRLETLSEKERGIIVKNQITLEKKSSFLYCHICKCSISGISNTLQHIQGILHKNSCLMIEDINKKNVEMRTNICMNQTVPPKFNNLTEYDCVTYNAKTNLYECNVCNCKISGSNNVSQHIQGSFHKSIAIFKDKKINHSINDNISLLNKSKDDFIEICFCTPCQVYLKNATMLQFHNLMHFYKDINTPLILDIIKYRFDKKQQPIIKCLLCNIFLPDDENLYKHFESPLHLNRLAFFTHIKDDIELNDADNQQVGKENLEKMNFRPSKHIINAFLCTLCDIPVSIAADKSGHQNGKKHRANTLLHLNNKIEKVTNEISFPNISLYACYICEKTFCDVANLLNHYKGKEHKLKMKCFMLITKNLDIKLTNVKGNQVADCRLCQIRMTTCRSVIEHILEKKHLERKQNSALSTSTHNLNSDNSPCTNNNQIVTLTTKIIPVKPSSSKLSNPKKKNDYETSTKESLKLGFSVENLSSLTPIKSNSVDVDEMLNDLIPLSLTGSQQKKLTLRSRLRKPRTPNAEGKKNISSFNQNAYFWGKSYIKHCINSGLENIYYISPEKLNLLKLGTTLTFPWESEHACLVCGEQFANHQILFEHLQDAKHIENLQQMEENDKQFEVYEFSDLELAKNYMQEESDDWVHCYACNNKVKNDDTYIRLHIAESNHIRTHQLWKTISDGIYKKFSAIFEEAWYYAQVFICNVCKIKTDMEIDFITHLESQKHLKNVTKLWQKGIVTEFGLCQVCITYWYGTIDFNNEHYKDQFHKRFAKNGDFMVPNMTITALDLLNNVDEQVKFLRNESNKAVLEKHKITELLKVIEETVESIYPNAKAYTFGSRLSHLGFVDSDVDVFLDCDNLYYNTTTQEQSQHYLTSVKKNFETQPNVWIVDEVLLVTRVPILKLRHITTGLKFDISFINGLSVEKSKLIGFYNTAYPICRELILYLKRWLALCQITGSDSITTFAISWYVIFYLQIKGILPSVFELIQQKNESKIVDGWECGFLDNFTANHSDSNFRDHLKGFFNFYAEFDYKTDVACPYLGKIIKKHNFVHEDQLPTEMQIYKYRLQVNYTETFRFDSPMCIQDPIDLSQNITKAVKKRHLRCFRQYCTESAVKC